MTYKLEPFIEKIKSPVVCVIDNQEIEFANGIELNNNSFDRHYLIESITSKNSKIFLFLKENNNINVSDWMGDMDDELSFF